MNFLRGRYQLSVAIGAICGALSRFYITEFTKTIFGTEFGFYGTFFVNVTGCFLIAYILTLAIENIRLISPEFRLMTTTGFCGAYTTFSTYGLETYNFLVKGEMIIMLVYFIGSLVLGMMAVQMGMLLARASLPRS